MGLPFRAYATFPLVSIRTAAGVRARVAMLRAIGPAKRDLREIRPDAVFSTGGYSSGPVMAAARSLGIPLAIHAVDSVPGRALRMVAPRAAAFTCGFRSTGGHLRRLGVRAEPERTGHPIRAELRGAVERREADPDLLLVVGGSQGSVALNELALAVAPLWPGRILLATGPKNHDGVQGRAPANVEARPYLDAEGMAEAYREAGIALARSGGTVAEFAMARVPSVLVPLPGSADDHQRWNAEEFAGFGGADVLPQSEATPERLAELLAGWRDAGRRERAEAALGAWDVPDSSKQIAARVLALQSGVRS